MTHTKWFTAAFIRLLRKSGILSVLFALMLMMRPALGAIGLVSVIAGYALILGAFQVMPGVELRGVRRIRRPIGA